MNKYKLQQAKSVFILYKTINITY